MKNKIYLLLLVISFSSDAGFLEYQKYRLKIGEDQACTQLKNYAQDINGLYEKAYFYDAERNCQKHSENFKALTKQEKSKFYEGFKKTYDGSFIESALNSNEVPDQTLLNLVSPRREYPELYERWQKKVIDRYLNNPAPAPNEDEGDVHSPVNFVRSDYESMIEVYVKNDKPEEAERLAREYGEIYSWTSQEDTKALMERIEKQKAYYEKKKQKEDAVKQKADPKKVTAKLTEAIEAYDEAKASTQANTSEGIAVKKGNANIKESEFSLHSMHEKYNLFIVAIVIVVGMYLVSLMRRKRS